jgi:PAS domain S-box-containing protein
MTAGDRAQSAGQSRHDLESRLESMAVELRRSTDRAQSLQALLDHNAVPTSQVDSDGRIVAANRALSVLTGIPHEQLVGSNLMTAQRWSHDPVANNRLRLAFEAAWNGTPSAFEGLAALPIGQRRIRMLLTPGVDADGEVTHLIANGFDITDALAAETAQAEAARIRTIEQSARQLQAVIDASPVSIYAKDRSGAFMFVNRAFEGVMGTTHDQIVGRRPADFPHRADRVRLDAQDRHVFETGASLTEEATFAGPNGEGQQTFLLNKFPLRDLNEEIYAVCVIATDITPLRAIEAERSLRARRNELIGSLAARAAEGALLPELRSAACDWSGRTLRCHR